MGGEIIIEEKEKHELLRALPRWADAVIVLQRKSGNLLYVPAKRSQYNPEQYYYSWEWKYTPPVIAQPVLLILRSGEVKKCRGEEKGKYVICTPV